MVEMGIRLMLSSDAGVKGTPFDGFAEGLAVAVLGTALVVYGWAHDRRRVRAALAKAKQPTRSIPGVPDHTVPAYVTEDELTGPAIDPSVTSEIGRAHV